MGKTLKTWYGMVANLSLDVNFNLKQCFGRIRIQKKFGYGFGSRRCFEIIFLCEKSQIKEKEKKRTVRYVVLLENFFLCRTGSRTHGMKAMRENTVQNIRIRTRTVTESAKKCVDPNPKKMNLNLQH
jgi:hypothetical protein